MTVVSNTSPILNLAAIGEAELLEKLHPSLLRERILREVGES